MTGPACSVCVMRTGQLVYDCLCLSNGVSVSGLAFFLLGWARFAILDEGVHQGLALPRLGHVVFYNCCFGRRSADRRVVHTYFDKSLLVGSWSLRPSWCFIRQDPSPATGWKNELCGSVCWLRPNSLLYWSVASHCCTSSACLRTCRSVSNNIDGREKPVPDKSGLDVLHVAQADMLLTRPLLNPSLVALYLRP